MAYTVGQCTAFVAALCPWVSDGFGDAHSWAQGARNAGLEVTHTPQPGRVAVFAQYQLGAGAYGHVALVTDVVPDAMVGITEMDWSGGPGVQDRRTLDYHLAQQLQYISPPPTGVEMTDAERLEVARALADLTYLGVGHRPAESPQVRDQWALRGVGQGFPQMVEAMITSPEFADDLNKDSARDHAG